MGITQEWWGHPWASLLQAKGLQLYQPVLVELVFQTLHQLCCPSLDTFHQLNVSCRMCSDVRDNDNNDQVKAQDSAFHKNAVRVSLRAMVVCMIFNSEMPLLPLQPRLVHAFPCLHKGICDCAFTASEPCGQCCLKWQLCPWTWIQSKDSSVERI